MFDRFGTISIDIHGASHWLLLLLLLWCHLPPHCDLVSDHRVGRRLVLGYNLWWWWWYTSADCCGDCWRQRYRNDTDAVTAYYFLVLPVLSAAPWPWTVSLIYIWQCQFIIIIIMVVADKRTFHNGHTNLSRFMTTSAILGNLVFIRLTARRKIGVISPTRPMP